MKIAKIVSSVGLLAMTRILVYGFTLGDFNLDRLSRKVARSVVWVALMMELGFFTASLYTLIALQTSGDDWKRFWMERRANDGQ